ncbi:hypothetical protein [Mitsuaria sp. GD03876]|uniref:hypothetical protein n=1 Tax=Mitsuaria sp. GD03876 TaxID=2975399 RepID=UPI0024475AAF|nr:hypothetical protein [Mitsuaria sp. GD03876]MDH0863032.1 hypothetical protein [Mitsuaria sp. GD03876]
MKPLLGVAFGQKQYVLTVLSDVEHEVLRSGRLRHLFPWFSTDEGAAAERLAQAVRLSRPEQLELDMTAKFLYDWVIEEVMSFTSRGRTPPSRVDCRVLAFGQVHQAAVVTDDLAMHDLANTFGIEVMHGHELLAKLRTAKMIDNDLVREIYEALERNGDLPQAWRAAKHKAFIKVFGPGVKHPS